MKAIQIKKPYEIEMIELETPKITKLEQVLVKVRAFGICGSDVGIYKGANPFATYPRIIGHEVSGEIIEIGEKVDSLKVGDKVVLEPIEFCGECYACTHGRHNVCKSLEVYGVHRDGGFCEYMVTDQAKWHKVDDSLTFAQAAVAEPFTIGEQCNSRASVQEGDWVLITGAGPMGILAHEVAKMRGANVIVSEINPKRVKAAREMGIENIVNSSTDNLGEIIDELTHGEGINVFFDGTGVQSVIEEGIGYLSPAARFVPLAFGDKDIPLNYKTLNKKEIGVLGTRLQYEKFDNVVSYLHEKTDLIDKYVTHIFPAENYKEAFETFMDPDTDAIKVVLTFD